MLNKHEAQIQGTEEKMGYFFENHSCICVGVSGGSDSNVIVHMIATRFRQYLPKIHFVFSNTGIEYEATLRHLKFMEERYQIQIDRIRPEKGESVVPVVKSYGVPMVSKHFSHTMAQALRGAPSALGKINGECKKKDGTRSAFNFTPVQKELAQFLLEKNIPVSDVCCELAKKKPTRAYLKKIGADLLVSGERRSEGGARATRHKGCFETGQDIDKYMPLFMWSDDCKQFYKDREKIVFSDCYEVWGMTRTGCVGCPFNSNAGEELRIMQKWEPKMYKLCMNVFGESYKLMDQFKVHRRRILETEVP